MKLLVASLLSFSLAALADMSHLPLGTYKTPNKSYGKWKSNQGGKGAQQVKMTISKHGVKGVLTIYGAGTVKPQPFAWKYKFKKNGFFNVVGSRGKKYGSGYCFKIKPKKMTICKLAAVFSHVVLEEHMTFVGNKLYVTGSKREGKSVWAWTQEMRKKK